MLTSTSAFVNYASIFPEQYRPYAVGVTIVLLAMLSLLVVFLWVIWMREAMAKALPQMVWITRSDGCNIEFNQHWLNYTGLTLEKSYGHDWEKPFHPDDQQHALNKWQNAVRSNAACEFEARLRKADGTYRWWLIHGKPVFDESGALNKWLVTCTDIHNFKLAEEGVAHGW